MAEKNIYAAINAVMQEVGAVASRVLFLCRGRLVFDGSTDEFLAGGDAESRFYELSREETAARAA